MKSGFHAPADRVLGQRMVFSVAGNAMSGFRSWRLGRRLCPGCVDEVLLMVRAPLPQNPQHFKILHATAANSFFKGMMGMKGIGTFISLQQIFVSSHKCTLQNALLHDIVFK